MELFAKIVSGFWLSAIITKSSVLDDRKGSEYTPVKWHFLLISYWVRFIRIFLLSFEYSEPCQKSKIQLFTKTDKGFHLHPRYLTSSKYVSEHYFIRGTLFLETFCHCKVWIAYQGKWLQSLTLEKLVFDYIIVLLLFFISMCYLDPRGSNSEKSLIGLIVSGIVGFAFFFAV